MVQYNGFDSNSNTASWDSYAQSIIAQYNLKKISNEYHGACPNCGGKDRFWINNHQGEVKVNCRQCQDWKRIIDIMRQDGLYPEFNPPKNQDEPKVYDFPEVNNEHPYLSRKKIKQHNAEIDGPDLSIPIIDAKGKRVGTQFIDETGSKKFSYQMPVTGNFSVIGGKITDFAYITEGWATACSVHEATGKPAVFALNAGNIPAVCEALQTARPNAKLIIAGDNDEAGRKACQKAFDLCGVEHVLPERDGNDWNDVWIARGPDATRKLLQPKNVLDDVVFPNNAVAQLSANYIVKNWLSQNNLSVVYGASNVGKSFFALSLAYHIAAGMEFFGNKVRQGSVLYLAAEGGMGFHNRLVALREKYHKDSDKTIPLALLPSPINLYDADEDIAKVEKLIQEISKKYGKVSMLVIDTLARATASGTFDENDNSMMSRFVAGLDRIREETRVHILLVHHSGKNAQNGSRGASSLKAACDAEIELTFDEDTRIRTARATKQRDMETGAELPFVLEAVTLGQDEDGDDVVTCVIREASDSEIEETHKPRIKGKNQKLFKQVFYQLRGEGIGGPNPAGTGWPDPRSFWCIDEAIIKDHFKGKLVGASNPSQTYKQAVEALEGAGHICANEGKIWFTDRDGRVNDVFSG